MEVGKINFLAGLPKVEEPSALGLAMGQTWRIRNGGLVTVVSYRYVHRKLQFKVRREFSFENDYEVFADGVSVHHGSNRFDLCERVMRVYIAGPMTGIDDLNFPAFNAAAIDYRKRGCFVINPAEIVPDKSTPWADCMRADIPAMLSCEMIVMLDGWTKSKGARLEHHIARELDMAVCYPANETH